MKTVILIWIVGYFPLVFIFDTYDACYKVEQSLNLVIEFNKLTPKQIHIRGYRAVIDFIPCTILENK